ncbi:MAG: ABC transporter permease subunit, partial [Candidatus Rokuibacteriota bacterium]
MSLTTLGHALLAGLVNGAFYAFLAVGFAAILGLTRALNLAHGELVVLGGYLGYAAAGSLGWPPLAVAPLAALAMVPIGLLWRVLLARVREPIELNSMVLTFGLSLLLQNVMLGAWSADYRLFASEAGVAPPVVLGLSRERAVAGGVGLAAIAALHVLLT